MSYVVNINSRTIHNSKSTDGRCKLNLIRDEHKLRFENLEDLQKYTDKEIKPFKRCTFCMGK